MIICPPEKVEILTLFCETLQEQGISTFLLPAKKAVSYAVLKKINSYLLQENIKAVHSHLTRSDLLAALLKQFFNSRLYIISTRHGYQEKIMANYAPDNFKVPQNLYYYITRYFLRKIDKNISISKGLSQLFINFKLTKEFFPVIYHGVDVKFDHAAPLKNFDANSPSLVVVGRLEPYKGHRFVIDALRIALQKMPGINLYIIGEGSGRQDLEKRVTKAGVDNNVKFLGFRSNALAYINAADLIIIPSLFEPFGLVFIEGIGLGKCVVAFDVPAGNEILSRNSSILVPKGNVEELAEQIVYYLNHKEERQITEKNAFRLYTEKYTTQKMVADTAAFYDNLPLPT